MDDGVREEVYFTFIWKIENFSYYNSERSLLRSPIFIANSLDDTEWYLMMYTLEGYNSIHLTFYLYKFGSKDKTRDIKVEYELELLGVDGLPFATSGKGTGTFPAVDFCGERTLVALKDFFQRESEYLPGDTLTVRCMFWNKDNELQHSGICYGRTRFEVDRGMFTWCVKDFDPLQTYANKITQIKTSSSTIPTSTFSLILSGQGTDEKFRLEATQFDTKQLNIFSFKMCVSGLREEMIDFAKGEHVFGIKNGLQYGLFQSFISKNDLMVKKDSYLSKSCLVLYCEVSISAVVPVESVRYVSMNPTMIKLDPYFYFKQKAPCAIKDHAQFMSKEEFLSDVNLRVDGKTFPAHKSILYARSPVFRAMFIRGMKEDTRDSVDITDLTAETVQHLLQYFYSDTIEDLQCDAISQLYEAADKYRVKSLKQKCSVFLKNNISKSNACGLLVLSDLHLDDDLKTFVLDFIMDNDKEIMQLDEWEIIEKNNPQLALETWKYVHFNVNKH